MDFDVERDPLSVLGTATGVFLVLVAAGTLVGAPWQYGSGLAATALQILGAAATAAIGAGLVALVRQ
ncbi:MAG: hypothetical protein ABEH77_04905 [Halobacteriaceae archaeon]